MIYEELTEGKVQRGGRGFLIMTSKVTRMVHLLFKKSQHFST